MKAKVVVPVALCVLIALLAIKINIRPRPAEGFGSGSGVRVTERTPKEPESRSRTPQNGAPTVPEPPATVAALQTVGDTATHDFDGNGYVGAPDYLYFETCLDLSGPVRPAPFTECRTIFDADGDGDVDLADFASFQRARGHLPIPVRDIFGNVLSIGSTGAYSGRHTCAGSCHAHDVDYIANGMHFQQGRTDTAGNIVMGDDAFGDGRWWNLSRGRYGVWLAGRDWARKDNTDPLKIGITSFAWIRECSGCHPGGGPGEFDRDGFPYFDVATGKFGFEALGKTWDDVRLDGDYSVLDMATGEVIAARWDQTGLSGPDCLFCHRADRTMQGSTSMNLTWRQATLAGGVSLVDAAGHPVRAFEAAGTAAQGWYSNLKIQGGIATVLQIDYAVGVANGSLLADTEGTVSLAPSSFSRKPRDEVCAPCHGQTLSHTGPWFDERDVHYGKLNNRRDTDPANDIPNNRSTACNYCHPGNLEHNFAKGDLLGHHQRDDLDWVNFRSCRECHLTELPDGTPNPRKHPDSPDVPGATIIHLITDPVTGRGPIDIVSCEGCHIPYGPVGNVVCDRAISVSGSWLRANLFYSADPLDPTNPDKSRVYPDLVFKTDSDGKQRLFPAGPTPFVYWADWDQNGTPADLTDDTIAPVVNPQILILTGGVGLPGVTDDNGDGRLEINRPEEILTYVQFLKGGNPRERVLATRPVLVKGNRVWYEDPLAPDGVGSFDFEGQGITMENRTPFVYSVDHAVFPKDKSWGYSAVNPELGCRDCHRPATFDSPVFDRLILVDPFDPDGRPVYKTVRQLTGLNPP